MHDTASQHEPSGDPGAGAPAGTSVEGDARAPGSAAASVEGDARVPGSAAASVVLGVAGVLTSFAVVPGAVCGVAAALLARHASGLTGPDAGRPGRGYAIAGQATGGLAILLSALFGLVFAFGVIADLNHRPRGRSWNSTQLRGISQGLVAFANSNKDHYPGLDAKGNILLDSAADTGLSGDGDTVEARYWLLLTGHFFTPEYAISPSETDALVTEYVASSGGQAPNPVVWDSQTRHFSYAMLSINGTPGQPPTAAGRSAEWQQSLNTQAIVMSDRNSGTPSTSRLHSIHSQTPGDWRGSVLWNDNHIAFEQSHYFETRYGNGAAFVDQGNGNVDLDHLFTQDPDADGNAGNDAFMIHDGD